MNRSVSTGPVVFSHLAVLFIALTLLLWIPHLHGNPPQASNTRENLHDVLSRTRLNPPLRSGDVSIRYSPDGRLLLAQTPVGIYVLSRAPLQMLGHILAPNSY